MLLHVSIYISYMSIKQKIEQAQTPYPAKVVFEITADELVEFAKQVSNVPSVQQSALVVAPPVVAPSVNSKPEQAASKSNKELQEKVQELKTRIETLENVIFENKQVLSMEEAAIFLDLSKSSLYKMTHKHELPFYRPNGKLIFFERADLLNWVRSARVLSEKELEEETKRKMNELANRANKRKK